MIGDYEPLPEIGEWVAPGAVRYNPYRDATFVDVLGQPVRTARTVRLLSEGGRASIAACGVNQGI